MSELTEDEANCNTFRGNSISYIYDKMLALKNSMGRARDNGIAFGREQRDPEMKQLRRELDNAHEQLGNLTIAIARWNRFAQNFDGADVQDGSGETVHLGEIDELLAFFESNIQSPGD